MKKVSLSPVERSTILVAFSGPLQGPNGSQKGASIAELRKATRIFDKLQMDDFLHKPASEEDR